MGESRRAVVGSAGAFGRARKGRVRDGEVVWGTYRAPRPHLTCTGQDRRGPGGRWTISKAVLLDRGG